MRQPSRCGWSLLVLAVALTSGGCAAGNAYRRGQSEAKKGNWDMAVAKLMVALEKDPDNISYKMALENAKVEASRFHYAEARKHMAADELDRAAEELDVASKYDSGNKAAADDLAIVQTKIRKRDDEKKRLADFERMKENAPIRVPVPTLSARSPVPITLRFGSGTKLQKVLDTLGKLAGVNILYDESFRDKDYEVNLTGVTFEEALDQITFTNRLFYKVLNQNTLMIVPESPQKRRTYDDSVLRTFYLQNADTNETLNVVKALTGIQKAVGNPTLGAITVLATPDKVALAERIIAANDKSKGEVVVEVRILEIDKTRAKEYGLRLSQYEVGASFQPTGNETPGADTTSLRAHLLSSLNLADWVVTVPQNIFAKFLQSESSTRILAAPRLRAAEGKKTTLKIGEEIPIPVTSFTVPTAGQSAFGPATSFQYKNVGITLDLTPKVNATGDISLELSAEFSILGVPRNVGGGLLIPSVITRNISGVLRLRDGETSLLGGLVTTQESSTREGALGVEKIPFLNRIFGQNTKNSSDTEVLISITPHIVRAPKITEDDLIPLGVGTEELVRVRGARPSLFGEPDPEPEPQAPADPTSSPAAGKTVPPPSAAPAPSTVAPSTAAPLAPDTMPQGDVGPPPDPMLASPPPSTSTVPPGPEAPPTAPEGPVTALFSPPELSLNVTATGTLALVLVGARDVRSVDLSLTFDARLVQAVDATAGSLLTLDGSSVSSQKALEGGRVRLRFSRATGASGSGVVAAVVFKGTAPGTASVAVESLSVETGTGSRPSMLPSPGRVVVTQ